MKANESYKNKIFPTNRITYVRSYESLDRRKVGNKESEGQL